MILTIIYRSVKGRNGEYDTAFKFITLMLDLINGVIEN